MFLAHIRQSDLKEQTVQEHLEEVASLARLYGDKVGLGAHAELAGFLHDMGKFTKEFTNYLKNAVIHQQVATQKIDHSTAGAKYLYEIYYDDNPIQKFVVETVGMAILSHHSGLQNFVQPDLSESDYLRRVTNQELPFYKEVVDHFEAIEGNVDRVERLLQEASKEFTLFMEKIRLIDPDKPYIYLCHMQKLIFSCLIDADRTNTRCFEEKETLNITNNQQLFKHCYQTLLNQIQKWEAANKVKPSLMNTLRNNMSIACDMKAHESSAILKLSIPTGGGKTFASLRYALKHAYLNKKSRIIYVVPYTTIIEQNAEAVRNILHQPDIVLEHHGNIIDDVNLDDNSDLYHNQHIKQLQLGRDNWDYPIIFTTLVQFLDTFYKKGTRKARRLHNLTNAVIIFDEVQSVPYQHFPLFNTVINFLHHIGNSSILLCTATQPAVDRMNPPIKMGHHAEIINTLDQIVNSFKRVTFYNKVDHKGWDALTDKIELTVLDK